MLLRVNMQEIYVSTDIETDGPIPGKNSMLSFGSAAYLADKSLIATYSANLQPLPNGEQNEQTMAWWKKQPEAWAACQENQQPIKETMIAYTQWIEALPGRPIFIAFPVGFDFSFIYWYLMNYVGRSAFSYSALDIKSYAMAMLKKDYRRSAKRNFPRSWFDKLPHTHIALDDAIEQGAMFCNMLRENVETREQ
jgi:hypothetical protein